MASSVNMTGRQPRSKSSTSSSFSSRATAFVTADWVTPSFFAAAEKLLSAATARKALRDSLKNGSFMPDYSS